jgi:hypothetical protein
MHKELREKYNAGFSEDKYIRFLNCVNTSSYYPSDFKIAETPLFLTDDFAREIINAAYNIVNQLQEPEIVRKSLKAIPGDFNVPGDNGKPLFIQADFAVSQDKDNNYMPVLVELQGFASLYAFQFMLAECYKSNFNLPEEYTSLFGSLDESSYFRLLKEAIAGNHDPQNVILLEIEPGKQKTRIDFALTHDWLGINTVCVTEIIRKGKELFYIYGNKEIKIERIYNRVIHDELKSKKLTMSFNFTDELNVEWAGHPNWFFRISKHSLPLLKGKYVPECYYLNELNEYPADLHNFVLKPLYSFAGSGVEIDINKERLDNIRDKADYLLQRKIDYTPFLATPDGNSKAEIRMMFIWPENNDKPILVNNLVRLSKGKMMGVAHNKNQTWVGSSAAFHSSKY